MLKLKILDVIVSGEELLVVEIVSKVSELPESVDQRNWCFDLWLVLSFRREFLFYITTTR